MSSNDIKTIKDILKKVVRYQYEQNEVYHKSKLWWRDSKSADFENNPYLLIMPIYEEIGELSAATNYAWWKNKENSKYKSVIDVINDLSSNFYMELVDLLHFVITAYIYINANTHYYINPREFNNKSEDEIINIILNKLYEQIDKLQIDNEITDYKYHIKDLIINNNNNNEKQFYLQFTDIISMIINSTLNWLKLIDFAHIHNNNCKLDIYLQTIKQPLIYYLILLNIVSEYIDKDKYMNMNFEKLLKYIYTVYIFKYALNMFRQSKGYRTGKYNKIWKKTNKEDNYIVMEYILNNLNELLKREVNYDAAYEIIEKLYQQNN